MVRTPIEDLGIGSNERRRIKESEGNQTVSVGKGAQKDRIISKSVGYIQARLLILG